MIPYGSRQIHPALGIRPNLLKWLSGKPAMAFEGSADKPATVRRWQDKARRRFDELLGDPIPAVDLRPRVLAREQMDGYRRLTLTLATAPSIRALAWLLVPDGASAASPLPAMIATPGHGLGAKDIIAMNSKGGPRRESNGYQKDYALAAVRHGVAVLAIEPLGFGERRDAEMLADDTHETGCHAAYTLATMWGTTLARLRIHDILCGLDYLYTRPEIDPNRIGLMGISGGGQITLWTRAVEPRFKLAIVSGYFNDFRSSVLGMHHCICNFVPGLARDFDMIDLAMMAAPAPLLIESGMKDDIFPFAAAKRAVTTLKRHYKAMGHADRLVWDAFDADHQWSGRKVGAFLDQWL